MHTVVGLRHQRQPRPGSCGSRAPRTPMKSHQFGNKQPMRSLDRATSCKGPGSSWTTGRYRTSQQHNFSIIADLTFSKSYAYGRTTAGCVYAKRGTSGVDLAEKITEWSHDMLLSGAGGAVDVVLGSYGTLCMAFLSGEGSLPRRTAQDIFR